VTCFQTVEKLIAREHNLNDEARHASEPPISNRSKIRIIQIPKEIKALKVAIEKKLAAPVAGPSS